MKKATISILTASLILSNLGSTFAMSQGNSLEEDRNQTSIEVKDNFNSNLRIIIDEVKDNPEKEVEVVRTEKETVGDYITKSLFSTSKYSTARSTVDLITIWGNQWAVNAKSMARDQNNKPYNIDKIYVKGSLYYLEDGYYVYKIGDSKTEYKSSDTMIEKLSGIDRRKMIAQGSHTYEHNGYKTITDKTTDTNPK